MLGSLLDLPHLDLQQWGLHVGRHDTLGIKTVGGLLAME
jgi:hypothetical protein